MKTTVTAKAATITIIESENGCLAIRLDIDKIRQQQVKIVFVDVGSPGIIGPNIELTQEQIIRPLIVRAEMAARNNENKFKIGDKVRPLKNIFFVDNSTHHISSTYTVDEISFAYYNTPCNSINYEKVT